MKFFILTYMFSVVFWIGYVSGKPWAGVWNYILTVIWPVPLIIGFIGGFLSARDKRRYK